MTTNTDGAGSFWQRSRHWPLVGQLAFALLVILVAAALIGAVSNGWYGDPGPDRASHSPTTARTSPEPSTTVVPTTVGTPRTARPSTTTNPPPTTALPGRLIQLKIAAQTHANSYDREMHFGGWIDVDGCKNTRAVLLIRTSRVPVTFTRPSACTVKTGLWTDAWSGVMTTVAHDFQIDHTVPLANAWRSGAWSWTHQRRVAFANNLADRFHLVPILASENGSKSDRGPDEWKPPKRSAWCRYALVWDRIKAKWHLSATSAEWKALLAMAATC